MRIILSPGRALLVYVALMFVATLQAHMNATPRALGLLRLRSATHASDPTPLAAGKFAVDDLSASGIAGASKSNRNNVDYVALDSGKEWARPIRGNANDVTFVSFQVYASQTTIIDIAGARLGLTTGPMTGGLQLMFDDSATGALQWTPLYYHVATDKYDGKNLAALPTMTVRLDTEAGTWDLYSGSRLLAENLPLIESKKSDRQFNIRAGTEGAWIAGLVLADENPIYEDANANAIDDRFEVARRGSLLPVRAARAERKLLTQEWRDAQRASPPEPFFVARPFSDRLSATK